MVVTADRDIESALAAAQCVVRSHERLVDFLRAGQTLAEISGLGSVWLNVSVPEAMAAGFAETRARGYAVNDEEVQAGAVAIASAVLDGAGRPVASLVLTGPAGRLTAEARERFGPLLREAARSLSDSLD